MDLFSSFFLCWDCVYRYFLEPRYQKTLLNQSRCLMLEHFSHLGLSYHWCWHDPLTCCYFLSYDIFGLPDLLFFSSLTTCRRSLNFTNWSLELFSYKKCSSRYSLFIFRNTTTKPMLKLQRHPKDANTKHTTLGVPILDYNPKLGSRHMFSTHWER